MATSILGHLIAAGIDLYHPIESGIMEFNLCKQRYGDKIAFMGNVNCRTTLVTGTAKQIKREVRRYIKSGAPGRGYVLASSNSLTLGCPFREYLCQG